ncbi:mitochondrial carrier domain-containing protein [Aspergillus candidus]|uniref:Mitochondrial carrier domain-containing protein n=1 Tax=Aspergillus candidus TaxID=41067 RepID=A0A2I2F9I2_ASPCN|nr:mitochondrial carrier domain-containing protein [Aspergillus candidus]PLB37258.1 mitochondrial carrier domain-containing protein [Aspergillus candidus]
MGHLGTATVPKASVNPAISLLSGCVAGAAEGFATYPFEFAKTSVQLRNDFNTRNPLRVIAQIVSRQGPLALYTGCSSLVLGNMGKDGVRFFAYDAIKQRLAGPSGHASLGQGILAGMCAGAVESVVAVTPSERIKTALIDDAKSGQGRRLNGMASAVRWIIRHQGVHGLYKGLLPTTMKQASTSAVRMGSYNILKEMGLAYGVQQSALTTFVTGAIAGTITVYTTQPFDSIKTRAQTSGSAGTAAAIRSIYSAHGLRGYWRGSTMRLGRLVMGGGIVFTVYENTQLFFRSIVPLPNEVSSMDPGA